uniref:Matrix metallopeptidase 21 n=1 Tax=Sphenodon punctatus TaxID=8508 RepID=A0A8D0GUS9_SPHPU
MLELVQSAKKATNKPQCGIPDQNFQRTDPLSSASASHTIGQKVFRRKRSLKTLFNRFKRARKTELASGSVLGLVFAKERLKWILMHEGYSSHLFPEEQRATLRLAFRLWSEVTPLEFEEVARVSEADIKLGFGTGRHFGCSQVFDGKDQELAHAWQHGDIHFDDDEHFTTNNSDQGISLLKVAVHEIGHVLGLPHIYRAGSVMQPNYSTVGSGAELDSQDRKAIQRLYGVCEGPFDTVFDWVREVKRPLGQPVAIFNTFFFRKGWYWMYENQNNRTRYGDPLVLSAGWSGLPLEGIDAALQIWTLAMEVTYFFKGTQYWKYDSKNERVFIEDSQGYRYPKHISQGFPGVPAPIDTAFFDQRDQHVYFFCNNLVMAFDVSSNHMAFGYPKKITEVFPAVVLGDHPNGNLDAAYFSYTHQAIFFFKGIYFWKVVDATDILNNPKLPFNGLLPKKRLSEQWLDICDVHSSMLIMK